MNPQLFSFDGFKIDDDITVEFTLTGWPRDKDESKAGLVSLSITGPLEEGESFETNIDLELPQARLVAATILALADYVESADRLAHKDSAA